MWCIKVIFTVVVVVVVVAAAALSLVLVVVLVVVVVVVVEGVTVRAVSYYQLCIKVSQFKMISVTNTKRPNVYLY